jgi:hypothetical protein
MSKNKDMVLTSVKLPEKLFEDFKVDCVKTKFSIQKLTERSMYLYMTHSEFKKEIHNVLDTFFTGSNN